MDENPDPFVPTPSELREDPVAWTLSTKRLKSLCSYCLEEAEHLQRCSRCKQLHYCGRECQMKDWAHHRVECKRLRKLATRSIPSWISSAFPDFPDDDVRLVGRLMDISQEWLEDLTESDNPGPERTIHSLVSHSTKIMDRCNARQEFQCFQDLFSFFTDQKLPCTPQQLLEIYGRVKVNCFGILNPKLQVVGRGLYLRLCQLEHSCDPNARILFKGKTAVVVQMANKCGSVSQPPVPLLKLRHSYIDNLMGLEERRKALDQGYFFHCECRGCLNEKRNRSMVAFSCEMEDCGGQGVASEDGESFICAKCGQERTDLETVKMVRKLGSEALAKLEVVPPQYQDKRLELASKTGSMIEGIFYEHNIVRMLILKHAYESCVHLKNWSDAVMYGEKVFSTYSFYLALNDPWRLEMGKNLAVALLNSNKKTNNAAAKSLLTSLREDGAKTYSNESVFMKETEKMFNKCS